MTPHNNKREEAKDFYLIGVLPVLNNYLIAMSDFILPAYAREGTKLLWMPDVSKIEALSHNLKETWEWLRTAWELTPNQKLKVAGFEESEDESMNQVYYPASLFPINMDLDDDQKAENILNQRNIQDYGK
jgi:hypothetical protein